MSPTALSIIKLFTAISFLCIVVVSDKLLAAPMALILLLGLGSIVSGQPSGFIFSSLALLSVGYLIFSVLIDIKKINFILSTISVSVLSGMAVYVLLDTNII